MSDSSKRAKYSDRFLNSIGVGREWAISFWRDHVEDKRVLEPIDSDDSFVSAVVDIQRFVYGDEGDGVVFVDPQPATRREMDGRLGSGTCRRMIAWADFEQHRADHVPVPSGVGRDYLIVGGNPLHVDGGVKIVSLDEPGNYSLGHRGSRPWGHRKPTMLGFGHWDVCTSARRCKDTLHARKLASSGCFDNPDANGDSIFYQFLDPGMRYGFHGGTTANKSAFFSYDMSNAVSLKYQSRYKSKVGIERPVIVMDKRERLGKGKGFLGMYAGQIHSLMYVLKALSEHTGLPLVFPVNSDGHPVGRNWKALWKSNYKGCATHRHLPSTTKWDIRGLEYQIIVMLLMGRLPMRHFPSLVESFRLHDQHWSNWMVRFEATCTWPELGIGLSKGEL